MTAPETKPRQETPWHARVAAAYGEPHRHYHTLAHVQAMLSGLDEARALAREPDVLEVAIWFHDAVYMPPASDNERRSAQWAREELRLAGWPSGKIERVAQLIEWTADHQVPDNDHDAALLMDLDLGILGAPTSVYDNYLQQIRREYAAVPDAAYRTGRLAFVHSMLSRRLIYRTTHFRARQERAARANLASEARRLGEAPAHPNELPTAQPPRANSRSTAAEKSSSIQAGATSSSCSSSGRYLPHRPAGQVGQWPE